MAAHSYYRIRYRFPDTDNTHYAEVFFKDAGGTDLCTGGTLIYSSQYNSGTPYYGAVNAMDRNTTTGYASSGNAGEWIGYHFAAPVEVAKIGVTGSGNFPTLNAKGILFEYSDDGTTWITQQAYFDALGNLTAGGYREYTVVPDLTNSFDMDPHRYWRINIILLNNSANYQEIEEIQFQNAAGTDLTTSGTASASSSNGSFLPALAFDDADSGVWRAGSAVTPAWIMWDFGSGNAQTVEKLMMRAHSSDMPRGWYVEYSDDNVTWTIRDVRNNEAVWSSNEERTYTFLPPVSEMIATFGFGYSIAAQPVLKTFGFDYVVESTQIVQTFGFDYGINEGIHSSYGFDYRIQIHNRFGFSYRIEADNGDNLGYRHIFPGNTGAVSRVFEPVISASGVGVLEATSDIGPVTYPSSVPLPDDQTFNHLNFYADYYNRIWVTPEEIRLSNPKIGFEYPFGVWSAYDRPNSLTTYTPTDVDGVSFVEFDDLPIAFKPVEFKYLHFTIDADAPSQIEGNLFFTFTMGGDGFDLFALVLGVLKTLPNEPFNEMWSWASVLEISRDGTEQRQALRDQPRTQAGYVVQILDEDDRRIAYQQFYSFATRSVIVPFFQYSTRLTFDVAIGATRLYFDLSQSDIRAQEYLVIFQPQTNEYSLVQVSTLNADGVNLLTPITFDVDKDVFEIVPGRSMRLPNKSALGMGAVNGSLNFKGESTSYRELLRPGSAITLESYEGYPVLPYKAIAQDDIDEAFDSDVEVIDNESAPPIQRSTFTNPFVESTKQYFVDRDTDMDWWRTFFDYTKGMLRPFLMPTWRDDLPLVEQPTVGDNELVTSNTDYIDYWPHATYQWVQIQSDAGVIYRRVEAVEVEENGLRLSLDENIGITTGVNENMIVSFLNLTRLNDDQISLEHYVNHTLITIPIRTVNQ